MWEYSSLNSSEPVIYYTYKYGKVETRPLRRGGGDGVAVRIFRAHSLQEAVVRARIRVHEAQRV
ncbi:MAG: hypothetical protein ACE5D1_06400, partial [Fidelibacterota bacterium]